MIGTRVRETTAVLAGCGLSVRNVPEPLWKKFPVFGVNLFPFYHPAQIRWWTAWDADILAKALKYEPILRATIFLNERVRAQPAAVGAGDLEISWYKVQAINGLKYSSETGTIFMSSLHAAVWIAMDILDLERMILVGFDCTRGAHFYDQEDKAAAYAPDWDDEMGLLYQIAESRGKELINASAPTSARTLPFWPIEGFL